MRMPTWTLRRPFIVFLIVLNIAFVGTILWLAPKAVRVRAVQVQSPQILATAPPFELIKESGEPFSSKQLEGGPWVANFIFTRCAGQCPMLSARFAAIQKNLPARARLVSFTVDPSYDSPAVLKEYATRFGADPERWVFLTGDETILKRIQTDLKLWGGEDPGLHSLRFILVDEKGGVRGYYNSEDAQELVRLAKDLRGLGEK